VVRTLKTVLTLRSLLALALMLWCAGTGCMVVSYARAAATEPSASSMAGHMMALSTAMDAHACCKAKHQSVQAHHEPAQLTEAVGLDLLTFPSAPQSGVMNCCPLTSGSIVVASRSQSDDRPIVLQQSGLPSLLLTSSDSPPVAVPLRLPNRAHAYLLDCAFLI
jgi:hypothetical protein